MYQALRIVESEIRSIRLHVYLSRRHWGNSRSEAEKGCLETIGEGRYVVAEVCKGVLKISFNE